ncbi:Dabb family protein [Pedobacter steynii]|uniref:Stress responsive alpha-beta barrel domain-containing protein n=1 Tax=Pedobacter steynii TaxID=430522 RepID=A0A1D7QQL2_9SPHI|nr:Dabb family protein [Pedobacter steynii]AOM80957.1 stress responsive alpha-beta barrel domain-containing protein [Pedobacter steynii]
MNKSNRRKFIGTAAAIAVGTAASAMPLSTEKGKYPVVHHVFFWLKNPDSKADREELIKGVKTLSKIETVLDLHVGIVAGTEKRDVIDSSWGVSELLFFKDLEGQAIYQTHPIHLEFIKNYSHLWAKVLVYDILEA